MTHRKTQLLTRRSAMIGSAAVIGMPWIARAQALPKVRFTAGWAFQGNQSYMLRAQKMGYFREAGVDVAVSRGFGSGRVPVDIAGGVFDLGTGEMSATLKFMAENPDSDLVIVSILEDTNQVAMTVRADGPIKTPKDIEGGTLAAPESDVGRQLFPAFARVAGIDISKITWISVSPELREPMLVQKRATGVTGNASSTALSLKRLGIDLPQQRIFFYRDSGLDLYSNCYVASRKFAEKNPAALKAALTGLFRAYVDYYRDATDSLKVLMEVEPLTDLAIETERVAYLKQILPMGKAMKEQGISTVDPARLELCIRTIEEAYGLPKRLTKERVYTDAYLPAQNIRMV
ncbi:ABC transporter substrate-binding protein [Roseiarcaceae bacterium H3SJ34-1]|uniref:ABC transporter substrate-binding protein n=1 Tax=Terripilifer ovatus TaxID=3032367 RepID=UPI003AB92F98|nr:ABC transporter substrate-binding protein [Roseiarcaceae bacterium H3SJ34-1]